MLKPRSNSWCSNGYTITNAHGPTADAYALELSTPRASVGRGRDTFSSDHGHGIRWEPSHHHARCPVQRLRWRKCGAQGHTLTLSLIICFNFNFRSVWIGWFFWYDFLAKTSAAPRFTNSESSQAYSLLFHFDFPAKPVSIAILYLSFHCKKKWRWSMHVNQYCIIIRWFAS
jgi:hypothetical protein